jgi:hypothetical protein
MVEDWTRAEQNILAHSQIHIESPATTLKTPICTLLVANPNWYQYHAALERSERFIQPSQDLERR